MPYSDADLLAEIRRVAELTDATGAPTVTAFNEHSDIADSTIHRRFGSWNEAVAAAGFDPNPPETTIPTQDLTAELHRLREAHGHLPTGTQMNADGAYSRSTYQKRFGSWGEALVAAFDDLESVDAIEQGQAANDHSPPPERQPGRPRQYSDDELIDELQRLATAYHDPPRLKDVRDHSEHGAKTYFRRFGSWHEALDLAGFEPARRTHVSTDDLLADLHRLQDELGEQPTAMDVVKEGTHGLATYQRRFGSWSDAAAIAFDDGDSEEMSG